MTEYTAEQIKENRRKWVEALRGGKYRQTRNKLKARNGAMCCLGVLAELAGCRWAFIDGEYRADGSNQSAPRVAQQSVGLYRPNAWIGETDSGLAKMNDSGASFAQIADLIENEPEGLFLPLSPPDAA